MNRSVTVPGSASLNRNSNVVTFPAPRFGGVITSTGLVELSAVRRKIDARLIRRDELHAGIVDERELARLVEERRERFRRQIRDEVV